MPNETVVYAFVLSVKKRIKGELASEQDLEKIRSDVGAPGATVKVIPPGDWNPPRVSDTSDKVLSGKMLEILTRVQDWFFVHAYHPDMTETITNGTVIRPKDGKKAFLAFKVG